MSSNGATALHSAAEGGATQVAARLLETGAEKEARDLEGRTAFNLIRKPAPKVSGTVNSMGHHNMVSAQRELVRLLRPDGLEDSLIDGVRQVESVAPDIPGITRLNATREPLISPGDVVTFRIHRDDQLSHGVAAHGRELSTPAPQRGIYGK